MCHVIFTDGDSEAERELARTGLTHLKQWGIRPFDLDSAAEAICEQFVRRPNGYRSRASD